MLSKLRSRRFVKAIVAFVTLFMFVALSASACDDSTETQQRQEQQKQAANKKTLEKVNLQKKLDLEEDPNRLGYVYLVTFGKPFGYYAIKGKVSSNGSQLEPENLVDCPYSCTAPVVIDGAQDDGTYGDGDPGIFFFTVDGTMVTTSLDYVYSSQPLPSALEIPKLG